METHPCRLEPIDVDAFFINAQEEAAENGTPERGTDLDALENIPEENQADQVNGVGEADGAEEVEDSLPFQAAEEDEVPETGVLERIFKPDTNSGLKKNNFRDDSKVEAAATAAPEPVNLERLADVAETIESLFAGAKLQASSITEDARSQADGILEQAGLEAVTRLERAKQKALEITGGAESQAGSILGRANKEAEAVVAAAREQADLIIAGAKQQMVKTLEKGAQQAQAVLDDARKEAAGLIGDAKKQAEDILNQAGQEGAVLKEQARKEGLEAGRQEALAAVKQELAANLTKALALINEIEAGRDERLLSSEPELLRLAVSIAEKIIGAEIALSPDRQLEIARKALSKAVNANKITIRINPDDLRIFSENLAALQSAFGEPKPIKLREDAAIPKGSCYLETDQGNLDARIKSQLDQIMAELLKVGSIE